MAIMGYLTTFETGPAPRSEAKIPIYRDSNLPDHQDGQVKPCPYSATLWGGTDRSSPVQTIPTAW